MISYKKSLPKLFLLFSLFFCSPAFSQSEKVESPSGASNIYLELLGNGIFASVNYDRRFSGFNNGLGGRAGIGYVPTFGHGGQSFLMVPLGINYLIGSGKSYLELGAGVTIAFGSRSSSDAAFIPSIGYRYQPYKTGTTFRIFYSPLFSADDIQSSFWKWGGLSVGVRL